MKLSDYCTIKKDGKVFIDLDTGWLLRVELHGMLPEYAQIFMRRLSKKRRLNDEEELMDAEVDVPSMQKQAQIAGAINSIDEMVICMAKRASAMTKVHAMTNDSFYQEQDHYAGNLYGHLNEYRFLLIDELMKI